MLKKVFISSDIEGVCGLSTWNETDKTHADYSQYQKIMTTELKQISEVLESEFDEIIIRDAHDSGKNIIHQDLPLKTKVIYGFNGHIDQMMFGLDSSFSFSVLHGYHAAAGSSANPVAHTECSKILKMTINGNLAGETTLSIYSSIFYHVPVCYICGDIAAVAEAKNISPHIIGTVTKEGIGSAIVAKHPAAVCHEIKADLHKSLLQYMENPHLYLCTLPEKFTLEVEYKEHFDAYRASFFPEVKQIGNNKVVFASSDFIKVLTFIKFCL